MSGFEPRYGPDDLLPLSGIQHYCFCPRQWALIHIEQQWAENRLTAEGRQMHERADDPTFTESRAGIIISRAMPVVSYYLGLTGKCDVVEFSPLSDGVRLSGRDGTFIPAPVEYKRGRPKANQCDEMQLCAQAICLEDMLSVMVPTGYLYYGQTRRRVKVPMSEDLRDAVRDAAAKMHEYYSRGYTPRVKTSKACRACSLKDICLPELDTRPQSASDYIMRTLAEG